MRSSVRVVLRFLWSPIGVLVVFAVVFELIMTVGDYFHFRR
jgi:hypothetical protein